MNNMLKSSKQRVERSSYVMLFSLSLLRLSCLVVITYLNPRLTSEIAIITRCEIRRWNKSKRLDGIKNMYNFRQYYILLEIESPFIQTKMSTVKTTTTNNWLVMTSELVGLHGGDNSKVWGSLFMHVDIE